MAFKAFENDEQSVNIGGDALTVENGRAAVTISGNLEITRDKAGLKKALALQEAVDSIVLALRDARDTLPDVATPEPPAQQGTIENPF